jgi:hypothetical protein
MNFRIGAAMMMIAAATLLSSASVPAAECAGGQRPCATRPASQAKPQRATTAKPVVPPHSSKPQSQAVSRQPGQQRSTASRQPSPQRQAKPRQHHQPRSAPSHSGGGSLGTAASVLGGVNDLLSTIQEMTPPEPPAEEIVDQPEIDETPPPPPVQPRRRGTDPNLVRAARKDLEALRRSDVPRSDHRTVLFSKYPADVVNAVMP